MQFLEILVFRVNYKHISTKELARDRDLIAYTIRQNMLVNPPKISRDWNAKHFGEVCYSTIRFYRGSTVLIRPCASPKKLLHALPKAELILSISLVNSSSKTSFRFQCIALSLSCYTTTHISLTPSLKTYFPHFQISWRPLSLSKSLLLLNKDIGAYLMSSSSPPLKPYSQNLMFQRPKSPRRLPVLFTRSSVEINLQQTGFSFIDAGN
jgi:hypothetical protein